MPPKATPKPTPDDDTPARQVIPATATEEREDVKLTRTGWAHFTFNADTYRLRRPMFGELKRLRLRLEDISDEITERSEATQRAAAEMTVALTEAEDDKPDVAAVKRNEIRKKSREAGRGLTQFADAQRVVWWAEVFAILCVDKTVPDFTDEDGLPAWIVDNSLPKEVMGHWRSAPLARG